MFRTEGINAGFRAGYFALTLTNTTQAQNFGIPCKARSVCEANCLHGAFSAHLRTTVGADVAMACFVS